MLMCHWNWSPCWEAGRLCVGPLPQPASAPAPLSRHICLSVLGLQRPGLSAGSTGFRVSPAACYRITRGCCESGGGWAPSLQSSVTLRSVTVRECSGLLPSTVLIVSVQTGCGDHASQPPHLACPWRGQSFSGAETKTQASQPSTQCLASPVSLCGSPSLERSLQL